mmetsp:Transcript_13889/g.19151  ORF Transcript_13889/g.19151 Transcript_13889/m.19151 type:complete len:251 (+) Transcript_13889:313-1065(+)
MERKIEVLQPFSPKTFAHPHQMEIQLVGQERLSHQPHFQQLVHHPALPPSLLEKIVSKHYSHCYFHSCYKYHNSHNSHFQSYCYYYYFFLFLHPSVLHVSFVCFFHPETLLHLSSHPFWSSFSPPLLLLLLLYVCPLFLKLLFQTEKPLLLEHFPFLLSRILMTLELAFLVLVLQKQQLCNQEHVLTSLGDQQSQFWGVVWKPQVLDLVQPAPPHSQRGDHLGESDCPQVPESQQLDQLLTTFSSVHLKH